MSDAMSDAAELETADLMKFNSGPELPADPTEGMSDLDIAKALWQALDDIDTYSDMVKPSTLKGWETYYGLVNKALEKRWNLLHSDGYKLQRHGDRKPEENAPKKHTPPEPA